MKVQLDSLTKQQINQCINLLQEVLGKDLLGIYLYGSSVVGSLQKLSDIDLFIVSLRPTTLAEKTKLITEMLSISGIYLKSEKRPVEITIVVKSEVNPWHYPPTFDFQYGDWLREEFESGNYEPWASKEMPDLALLITQVLLASETLFGPSPNQLLDPVPYCDFITATVKEINTLIADLESDTRNVLLTLARVWCTLETDSIQSKPKAATWVIEKLPSHYQPVLKRAHAICIGKEIEHWEDISMFIQPCAKFMVEKIKEQVSLLENSNNTNRSIKLAE